MFVYMVKNSRVLDHPCIYYTTGRKLEILYHQAMISTYGIRMHFF